MRWLSESFISSLWPAGKRDEMDQTLGEGRGAGTMVHHYIDGDDDEDDDDDGNDSHDDDVME